MMMPGCVPSIVVMRPSASSWVFSPKYQTWISHAVALS